MSLRKIVEAVSEDMKKRYSQLVFKSPMILYYIEERSKSAADIEIKAETIKNLWELTQFRIKIRDVVGLRELPYSSIDTQILMAVVEVSNLFKT